MYVIVKNDIKKKSLNFKHNNKTLNKRRETFLLTLISKKEEKNKKITNIKKIKDINKMEITFSVIY